MTTPMLSGDTAPHWKCGSLTLGRTRTAQPSSLMMSAHNFLAWAKSPSTTSAKASRARFTEKPCTTESSCKFAASCSKFLQALPPASR
eukprot:CAMPEP_0115732530 /NCGR_PEP_ID=MMETSP0272-20121206/85173_1 /TAXON_ID=71861 /ORGANISM="Scrippsiella trochoidea, Strain CCMP3099" /LENGTH=87 /DNA_ID=CAMNT_0003176451 /DNA_START=128 /DNA_END=391 /DNA_ORIENTATION=+